jgi:hypothetical protein
VDEAMERAHIRVLLCGDSFSNRAPLLHEITLREVLDPQADPSLELVTPEASRTRGEVIVPMDQLHAAVVETEPDLVLVLADEAGLARARRMLDSPRGGPEVIGLTVEGHALLNLGPSGLRELMRATVAAGRARRWSNP